MDWQQAAALALVAIVIGACAYSRWRRRAAGGCDAGCCGGKKWHADRSIPSGHRH